MKQYKPPQAEYDVIFRSMEKRDIPEICEIEREAFPTPWTEDAFFNELTNNFFAHYVIMEIDGEVAGYGGMWIIREEAHITNIAVKAKYRGKKLGHLLMRQIQNKAVRLHAETMTLEVRRSNHVAQHLYELWGFHKVGVRPGYYTDNQEDAIIMWADLPKRGQE